MKRCRILSIMLLLTLIFSMALPTNVVSAAKKKIAISDKKITLEVGETHQLSVTGTKAVVSWISADESIATVDDDGMVTGKAEGKTKVTGKIGSKKYSCTVTVEFHNYKTLMFPYSEYTEMIANTIEFKGKNVELDIDDESITIRATEEEFRKIDEKCMKSFLKLISGAYTVESFGNEYDFYETKDCDRREQFRDYAYKTLIQGTTTLALHAYLNGGTEEDVVIRLHRYHEEDESMDKAAAKNSIDDVITVPMPTLEEIYADSDPDC